MNGQIPVNNPPPVIYYAPQNPVPKKNGAKVFLTILVAIFLILGVGVYYWIQTTLSGTYYSTEENLDTALEFSRFHKVSLIKDGEVLLTYDYELDGKALIIKTDIADVKCNLSSDKKSFKFLSIEYVKK